MSKVVTVYTPNASVPTNVHLSTQIGCATQVRLLSADLDLTRLLPIPSFTLQYDQTVITVPESNILTGYELSQLLQSLIPKTTATFSFSSPTMELSVKVATGKSLTFDETLQRITGLPNDVTGTMDGVCDLTGFTDYVFLLLDIMEPQFFNNTRLPLLAVFSVRPGDDSLSVQKFQTEPYGLNVERISTFTLSFVNQNLQRLTFLNNRAAGSVQLAFD